MPADENVSDTTWLAEVGRRGWVALMKDAAIRRRPAEKDALLANDVRAFCLSGGNLPADEMARRYVASLEAITTACLQPGPFLYAVHVDRINRLDLTSLCC